MQQRGARGMSKTHVEIKKQCSEDNVEGEIWLILCRAISHSTACLIALVIASTMHTNVCVCVYSTIEQDCFVSISDCHICEFARKADSQ